ncbi:MAG: hypothetical protein IJR68_05505 [Fretibacterium sp.]|jgi:hypothetical protein|nr:hypothetical protein [Fretibacterium sp.]
MINFNSYDTLGKSGMALMQSSMNLAGKAAERVSSGSTDVMDIAQTSMDMSQAKVQMAMGAYLVRSQNELMETSLQILDPAFGVGTRYDHRF